MRVMASISQIIKRVVALTFESFEDIIIKYCYSYFTSNFKNSIAVYIHLPISIDFIKETLIEFKNHGYKIDVYSDKADCFDYYIDFLGVRTKKLHRGVKYRRYPIMLTSVSGFPNRKFHPKIMAVHMFHSLVSIHDIYNVNSFNNFDILCCAGPHHNIELTYVLKDYNRIQYTLNTGYNKIDRYALIGRGNHNKRPTILFAPSWHEENLLRLHGYEIISQLINNYNVVLRPHPISLKQDMKLISLLLINFASPKLLILDDNIDATNSMSVSDLMISDYSGVAMEFALALKRPVIFMDTPRKSFNPNWREIYQQEGVQVTARSRLGYIINNINELEPRIKDCINERNIWEKKLEDLRSEYVYNFGHSKDVAFRQLTAVINGDFSDLRKIDK
jgi:hypothetical protein